MCVYSLQESRFTGKLTVKNRKIVTVHIYGVSSNKNTIVIINGKDNAR